MERSRCLQYIIINARGQDNYREICTGNKPINDPGQRSDNTQIWIWLHQTILGAGYAQWVVRMYDYVRAQAKCVKSSCHAEHFHG